MPWFQIGGAVATAIKGIWAFFASTGPVAAFFAWIGKIITTKALVVPIHIALMTISTTARIVFLGAVVTFGLAVYNKINSFLGDLPSLFTSNEFLIVSYKLLQAIGFTDALVNAFASFSLILTSLFVILFAKLALYLAKATSDEFFKLGLLLSV